VIRHEHLEWRFGGRDLAVLRAQRALGEIRDSAGRLDGFEVHEERTVRCRRGHGQMHDGIARDLGVFLQRFRRVRQQLAILDGAIRIDDVAAAVFGVPPVARAGRGAEIHGVTIASARVLRCARRKLVTVAEIKRGGGRPGNGPHVGRSPHVLADHVIRKDAGLSVGCRARQILQISIEEPQILVLLFQLRGRDRRVVGLQGIGVVRGAVTPGPDHHLLRIAERGKAANARIRGSRVHPAAPAVNRRTRSLDRCLVAEHADVVQ
jgi:hypothetical protein